MKYGRIAHTDMLASKLVLGTDQFGTALSDEVSFALLDRFVEAGGNMLDTASLYGGWCRDGMYASERTIGRWLAANGCRRETLISTKGGHFDLNTRRSRLNFREVKEDFEHSLDNLQTDYIDVYWLHKDDATQSPEELIAMLNEVTQDGHVRALGVSNWSCERILKANAYAAKQGLRPIVAGQIQHSIARVNTAAEDILVMTPTEYEAYCESDLSLFAFSTQAKGFFSIVTEKGVDALPPHVRAMFLNEYNLRLAGELKRSAAEQHTDVSALVLAALINDRRLPTFAQIGPQTVEQLNASLQAAELEGSEGGELYDL